MPRITDIDIYEMREHHILAIRTRANVKDLMKVTAEAYPRVFAYLAELNEMPTGYPFITYHNMDMNDLDIAVGVPISKELPARGDIVCMHIPSTKAVTCLFRGPYYATESTYNEMHAYVLSKGLVPQGTVREIYYNSPVNYPEDELLTRIKMPVK